MPFDMTPRKKRQPRKPQIDRDAAARAVQRQLGRPLTWLEYCRVWNEATKAMGRKDFLTGEVK